jgi:general secretion pathway protein B
MSYILDALKKAEAERNPGSGPNPNPQAAPTAEFPSLTPPSAQTHAPRDAPWLWIGMTAAAVAVAALVWLKPWQPDPAPAAVTASIPIPAVPAAPAVSAAPPAAPIPQQAPRPPVAAAPAEAAAPPAPRASKPEAASVAKTESRNATVAKQPAGKKPPKAQASEPAPAKEAKPKPAPAPASENRVASLQELPAHIQSEIPRLSVSGYIYSANRSDRTVLINTRLLREGEQVAPDLVLEQLTPTGMVLNYKGYRYRTSY